MMTIVYPSTIKAGMTIEQPIKVSEYRTLYDRMKVKLVSHHGDKVTVLFDNLNVETVEHDAPIYWYAL